MLRDYLPAYELEYDEIKETEDALDPEIVALYLALDQLDADSFILSATENGIKRFEKILRITPKEGQSLESRRLKVLLKWNDKIPYTIRVLRNRLASALGTDKFRIDVSHLREYILNIITYTSDPDKAEAVDYILETMIPANLAIYTILENDKKVTFKKREKIYRFEAPLCGTIPYVAQIGSINAVALRLKKADAAFKADQPMPETTAGVKPYTAQKGVINTKDLALYKSADAHKSPVTVPETQTGISPYIAQQAKIGGNALELKGSVKLSAYDSTETGTSPYAAEVFEASASDMALSKAGRPSAYNSTETGVSPYPADAVAKAGGTVSNSKSSTTSVYSAPVVSDNTKLMP